MAKSNGKSFEVFNVPLSDFLIALAVDPDVRRRFAEAKTDEAKKLIMAEFELSPGTMEAVIKDTPDGAKVRSTLRISDQQASSTPPPPTRAGGPTPSKKR